MGKEYSPLLHVGRNPLSMTYEEYMKALKVTKIKSDYRKKYNNLPKE